MDVGDGGSLDPRQEMLEAEREDDEDMRLTGRKMKCDGAQPSCGESWLLHARACDGTSSWDEIIGRSG